LRRRLADAARRRQFATGRGSSHEFQHRLCAYARPLLCYPGQEDQFAGKRNNTRLVLAAVDHLVLQPGQTFSFWRCVGRPTAAAGFLPAAALKDRRLVEDIGGAICLPSTLLYNAALLSGMTILERHCHSIDSYGSQRYFELGRDAAVEYPYRDLCFRNDWPVAVMLGCRMRQDSIVAEVWAAEPLSFSVEIEVSEPIVEPRPTLLRPDRTLEPGVCVIDRPGAAGITVRTARRVTTDGMTRVEDLGASVHHADPREARISAMRFARTPAD
jgi:vancomycin resistance protein YoaR